MVYRDHSSWHGSCGVKLLRAFQLHYLGPWWSIQSFSLFLRNKNNNNYNFHLLISSYNITGSVLNGSHRFSWFAAINEEALLFPSDGPGVMAEGHKKWMFGNAALDTLQVNLGINQTTENFVTHWLISFCPQCFAIRQSATLRDLIRNNPATHLLPSCKDVVKAIVYFITNVFSGRACWGNFS